MTSCKWYSRTLMVMAVPGGVLLDSNGASAEESAFPKKTLTYKTVGKTKIQADVYRPGDEKIRPVLVWIHGGALILGSRESVPKPLLELCRSRGYVLVSLDYRLAPEVKLPDIAADIDDAFAWIRKDGPKLFHADPDRLVFAGGSAGGYLTLLTGTRIKPRPRALLAYWGYGDIDGERYTKSSEHYRKQDLVSKDNAYRGVVGDVVTNTDGATSKTRGQFYLYLRQNGLWTKEVTGFDPQTQGPKLDPFCPARNLTAEYPPTLLIHGTEDTDVPYAQSVAMEKELGRQRVLHELITVPGAGHGLSGGDKKLVGESQERALAFIRKYLE